MWRRPGPLRVLSRDLINPFPSYPLPLQQQRPTVMSLGIGREIEHAPQPFPAPRQPLTHPSLAETLAEASVHPNLSTGSCDQFLAWNWTRSGSGALVLALSPTTQLASCIRETFSQGLAWRPDLSHVAKAVFRSLASEQNCVLSAIFGHRVLSPTQ